MMPYCEYRRCKRVAEGKPRILRMWSSYHHRDNANHTQEIWLCNKHLEKINRALCIERLVKEEKTS